MPSLETLTCVHYGVCGGCACRVSPEGGRAPAPYDEQLREKEQRVRALMAGLDVGEWRPIVRSPDELFYRNKMEFAFAVGWDAPELVLGLREAGRFDRVVDLQECLLMSPDANRVLEIVRAWAKRAGLSGYHRRRHEGDLRYLVLREGKHTGQRMAILIASRELPQALLDELRGPLKPLVTTCWLGVTDTRSDVARAETMHLLWGSGVIGETLGRLHFEISPYSFFQTNTRGTELLYGLLAAWARPQTGVLLDLYCGAGGIGLSLSHCFDRLIGIDTNRDSIQDAARSAERNAILNAEFVCDDAMHFLAKLPASKASIQLASVIVDPPRPGLHAKAMQALLEINPARLAYVSCNPESLARDLQIVAPLYRIASVQPVDLFPQTPHVETVAFLEHR